MLSQFQASYQRVEQSLQRLTDSIAAYNPSTSAADELVAADSAVDDDLKQLAVHQSNHLRIQELRKTTESLDETIKSSIRQLAEIRKAILAIPSNAKDEPRREVKVDELLSYAKFISKTTVPPTFRKPLPAALQQKTANGEAPAPAQIENGMATPPLGAQEHRQDDKIENVAVKSLDEGEKAFLDPLKDLPFEPWPSQGVIQQGGLAAIQRMVEEGKDPAMVLTAEEQAEADRKRKEEREEEEKREREEMERWRMNGTAQSRAAQQADVFDPDEA